MPEVTYLLGAGASANSLPVVSNFRQRLVSFRNLLNELREDQLNPAAFEALPKKLIEFNPTLTEIITEINWLIEESTSHQTIDTFAKKLYLTNSKDLFRLKKILILFFTIEQMARSTDLRYDSFLASIFKKSKSNLTLNNSVRIITWNYDMQIELTLRKYITKAIYDLKDEFQIYPNVASLKQNEFDISKFSVIKLNGEASWNLQGNRINDRYYLNSLFNDRYQRPTRIREFLGDILEDYEKIFKLGELPEFLKHMNFAWESDENFDSKHENYSFNIWNAIEIAKQTDILVIIGYSFPVFNREIDFKIMDEMIAVDKVYIQDNEPEKIKSTIENAFKWFSPQYNKHFQLEKNVNQFVIPYEL
jgi:hypothetical protein